LALSEVQQEALGKLSLGKWISSYELKVGLGTLQALVAKGLVESRNDLGAMSSPFTCIRFRKLFIKQRQLKRRKPRKLKRRVK
jgi:hypothetical protein